MAGATGMVLHILSHTSCIAPAMAETGFFSLGPLYLKQFSQILSTSSLKSSAVRYTLSLAPSQAPVPLV